MKKIISLLISFILSFSLFASAKHVDIIFSSDIHSFIKYSSKSKTVIDRQKEKNPDTLVLDGGDFSMGTLFQTIYESQASELRTLGLLGVDVTTIGNHEFDFGAESLSKMFRNALKSGDRLPAFVLCNADWKKDNEYTKTVKKALVDEYGSKDYVMLQKGDVSIAVIGVFGEEAFLYSPTCEMSFEKPVTAVRRTVDYIKANEKADVIICVSHSGIQSNIKKSEDEQLALAVPEIDVIISGHTHSVLQEPIIHGNTIIGACGAYNHYLGNISITQKEDGRWALDDYHLSDLHKDIPEDAYIASRISDFEKNIDQDYLSNYNLKTNQIISTAQNNYDINKETGYLMAEAVYDSVKALGGNVDVAVVPSGVLRGTYTKGDVKVSDVFESYSLGIGDDGLAGYPLIEVYLTGKELKNMAEIDCSLSPLMDTVRLFTSGFSYTYNPKRLLLNKVTECFIVKPDGSKVPVESDKLYRVITDKYTGMMIGGITGTTKGLITIIPKRPDGSKVTSWSDTIIRRKDNSEMKGWIALTEYYKKFKVLPSESEAENIYVVADASLNPIKLFSAPSKLYIILRLVLLFIILLITGIIVLIKSKKRK